MVYGGRAYFAEGLLPSRPLIRDHRRVIRAKNFFFLKMPTTLAGQ